MTTNSSAAIPSQITVKILELMQLPGFGPAKAREILRGMSSFNDASLMRNSISEKWPSIKDEHFNSASEEAEKIINKCGQFGISVISLADSFFPKRLAEIRDVPPILYVRGSMSAVSVKGVAVVGTREASVRGLRIAGVIATAIVQHDFSVVSGLALGIDAAAHKAAVEANGITIAVLAHGLDIVTPKANQDLAERILACGGALVSEHPPGVPPYPPEFVRRNRIQSGLSMCSIIVESGRVGGAIHQAHFTKTQSRKVYVSLPAEGEALEGFNREGADHLMAECGAIPLRNTRELNDVISALEVVDAANEMKRVPQQKDFGW